MDNKELARMFFRYWGCKISWKHHTCEMVGISNLNVNIGVPRPDNSVTLYWQPLKDCKLILKPIEDISDDDKLSIGRIFDDSPQNVKRVLRIITGVINYHYLNTAHSKDYTAMEWAKITGLRGSQLLLVSDKLRDLGYDIDNLIPRGYAVGEKEVKNG